MLRFVSMIVLLAVLAPASFGTRPASGQAASGDEPTVRSQASTNDCWQDRGATVYVPETGHHIHEPFLSVWRQYDLAILGYPVSEALELDGMTVQYFERARFEHHPEFAGTDHEVLFTLLGRWLTAGVDDPAFNSLQPDTPQPDPEARYYPETGHYLGAPFNAFWDEYGGLPVFGYPLSELLFEDGRLVQYFERARFERHPEFAGTPYEIQLGHLGRERAGADGIDQRSVPKRAAARDDGELPEPRSYSIPALMYHRFGTPASRYQVTRWDFEQQLEWLRDNGYTAVTMEEVYDAIYGGVGLPEKPVMITIDDGLSYHWETAATLERYGMRGVFFVTLEQGLTEEQIRDIHARGHEIGSHTFKHPQLPLLSDNELRREIAGSRAALTAIIGAPVEFFSYPYGQWNERVIATVQAAGYCGAVHAWGGRQWTPDKRWAQPRIEITGATSLAAFATIVSAS